MVTGWLCLLCYICAVDVVGLIVVVCIVIIVFWCGFCCCYECCGFGLFCLLFMACYVFDLWLHVWGLVVYLCVWLLQVGVYSGGLFGYCLRVGVVVCCCSLASCLG